jgi:MFS family permease
MTFGTYGLLLVNSFAFQQQRGASALATALWFLPMPLTYLAAAPLVNRYAHRVGPRAPMAGGLVLMAAGMAVYAVAGPRGALAMLVAAFVLTGAGLALTTGPAVGLAMAAVPVQRAGLASGVVNLARLVGITVGVAVLGSALAAAGAREAVIVGGVVQLVAAAVALRMSRTAATTEREVCHA